MAKLTLTKETEPNGKVYYYIMLDGRVLHCETDKDIAEKIYQTVRRNAGIKTVEILKSEGYKMEGSKKLENFPAFPCNSPDGQESYRGMSKRFYAACAAMQAILSNEELRFKCIEDSKTLKQSPTENIIEYAYQNADELLRQEANNV